VQALAEQAGLLGPRWAERAEQAAATVLRLGALYSAQTYGGRGARRGAEMDERALRALWAQLRGVFFWCAWLRRFGSAIGGTRHAEVRAG